MKRKQGKYIAYIDVECFDLLCQKLNIKNGQEREDLYINIMKDVSDFVEGERSSSVFCAQLYTDKTGKRRRIIEIIPLLSSGNQGTLHYLRKMNYNKTRANKHGNKH